MIEPFLASSLTQREQPGFTAFQWLSLKFDELVANSEGEGVSVVSLTELLSSELLLLIEGDPDDKGLCSTTLAWTWRTNRTPLRICVGREKNSTKQFRN